MHYIYIVTLFFWRGGGIIFLFLPTGPFKELQYTVSIHNLLVSPTHLNVAHPPTRLGSSGLYSGYHFEPSNFPPGADGSCRVSTVCQRMVEPFSPCFSYIQ